MKKLLLILFFAASLFAQTNQPVPDQLAGIDDFINGLIKEWNVPGLAIAIVKDGNVIYSKGYGVRNTKTGEPVTANTLFSIASSSKSFTATLAAMLVDEKKIDFDTPLKKYFPDFEMYDPCATDKVTLRDLLVHRTGIPRQKFFSLNTPATRKEVRYCMKYFEPNFDFRSRFQYCNETYSVAGDMIAEAAGTLWEDLITKRILEPLQMNETILSVNDLKNKNDFASPYIDWEEGKVEEMDLHNADILGAAGCIISNVDDLLKWVLFNLNKGKVGDNQLIKPQRLAQIQFPQMPVPQPVSYKEVTYQNYGMGWFIDTYRGYLHVHHGGVLYGFSSQISFLPMENTGLVILANLNGTPVTTILEWYVYDRLLGLDPVDWNKRNKDELAKFAALENQSAQQDNAQPAEQPKTSLPLNKFIGTFKSNGYGSITIRVENDTLKTNLLEYVCPLIYSEGNTFELYHPVEHQSWTTTFNFDDKGEVNSLSIQVNPGVKAVVFKKL